MVTFDNATHSIQRWKLSFASSRWEKVMGSSTEGPTSPIRLSQLVQS